MGVKNGKDRKRYAVRNCYQHNKAILDDFTHNESSTIYALFSQCATLKRLLEFPHLEGGSHNLF